MSAPPQPGDGRRPPRPADEEWVVWNGTMGVLAMAKIGHVEAGAAGRSAWLDRPYEMVGPFSLDELEAVGRIAFAACVVMSRQRWQADQVGLRAEAHARRREAQERERRRHRGPGHGGDERQHRQTLNLPAEGALKASQIKAAFRRLAQKAHPDTGGSHEAFVRLTEARNALLEAAD